MIPKKWRKHPRFKIFLLLSSIGVFLALTFLYIVFQRQESIVYATVSYSRSEWNETPFPPEYWQVNALEPGMVSYDSLGRKIAEITNLQAAYWGGGARNSFVMDIKLQTLYDPRSNVYLLNNQPLSIGESINLTFENVTLEGVIEDIYFEAGDRFKRFDHVSANVTVKYSQLEPWHAESLQDFFIEDSTGEKIAEVTHAEITPADMFTPNDRGVIVHSKHPVLKDVELTVHMPKIMCVRSSCIFNFTQPLTVGAGLWLDAGTLGVGEGSVKKIEIIDKSDS